MSQEIRDLNPGELRTRLLSLEAENAALRETLDHANEEIKNLRKELVEEGRENGRIIRDLENDLMAAEQGGRRW